MGIAIFILEDENATFITFFFILIYTVSVLKKSKSQKVQRSDFGVDRFWSNCIYKVVFGQTFHFFLNRAPSNRLSSNISSPHNGHVVLYNLYHLQFPREHVLN